MTESFKVFKLDNGLKYVHSKIKTTKLVTVAIFFRLGSIWEDREFYGGSHFLEHFLFKGCEMYKSAKELNSKFDSLGAIINASTSHEYTNFYGVVNIENFEEFFKIISNMVLKPVFNPQEFEKEKNVVIEELKMYLDKPEDNSEEELYTLMFGNNHRLGRKIGGEVSDVKKIKIETLEKFHKNYYLPQNACISICGNIDEHTIHDLILKSELSENYHGNTNIIQKIKPKINDSLKIKILPGTMSQEHAYINIGFIIERELSDIEQIKIDFIGNILSGGLSSRLFHEMREKYGVSYTQNAGFDNYIDSSVFVITTSVDNDSIFETNVNNQKNIGVMEILSNVIKRLKNEQLSQKELEKVKACSLSMLRISNEKCHQRCLRYGEDLILNESGHILSIEEEENIIKNITIDDISKLTNDIFNFNNCSICICSNIDEKDLKSHISKKQLFQN